MKATKISLFLLSIMAFLLAACNKDKDNFLYKDQILPIIIKGYNATNEELKVQLDTFSSPRMISSHASFEQSESYTLRSDHKAVKLNISEKSTGKLVFEKELKKEDGPVTLNFLYMDGRISDMPEKPAVQDEKISLTYMFVPDITGYSQPVDFVIGKYFSTPKVFEEITRLKNVKPYEFSESARISTFSTARQEYNGVMTSVSFQVRIYKAGTNIPYVDGTAYTWNELSSTAPKPAASTASSKLYIISEYPNGNIMRFFTRLEL